MGWTERKLAPHFGVELSGQKLGDPSLPQSERDAVLDAVERHGVAVVRDQGLDDDTLMAFARTIGTPMEGAAYARGNHTAEDQKIYRITNLDRDGNILPEDNWDWKQNAANELWHIDSTYIRPRHHISMLYGNEVPPQGADTEYCDLRLFWESLSSEEQAFLQGRTARHSLIHSRTLIGFTDWNQEDIDRFTPVERPLVALHEPSGRTALHIASHIFNISGMADDEAVRLVADLTRRAATAERCYAHKWRQGDLVIWDNRALMHRATPFASQNYRRDMRTCRLIDLEDVPAMENA